MNYKRLLFGFISVILLFYPDLLRAQDQPAFIDSYLKEALTERMEKQDIPDQDSIAANFYSVYSGLAPSEKQALLNTLNYADRKAIINRNIDKGSYFNSKGDSLSFNKSVLYIILENTLTYYNKSRNDFSEWLLKADDLTKENKTTVTNFMDFITRSYFFTKGYLRKSNLVDWLYTADNYRMKYNAKTRKLEYTVSGTDLICIYGNTDTMIIRGSTVKFRPLDDSLSVSSGTVKWEDRFGSDFKGSYVTLSEFGINMQQSKYKAANAQYHNSNVLRGAIAGDFEDGVSAWARKTGLMPSFESYKKNVELVSEKKNFRFFGGLTIEGYKLQISGDAKNPAELHYYRNGQLFFKSQSLKMGFFSAENAAVTIYTDVKDSIWHPACTYVIGDDGFYVSRIPEGKGQNLFQISDIKMETNMRTLGWQVGSDSIKFYYGDLSSVNIDMVHRDFERQFEKQLVKIDKTIFRSVNYFNAKDFERLKMYETRNPLFDIRNLCAEKGTRSFTIDEYANYVKINSAELKLRLLDLTYKGFLEFDESTERITVNQKLFDHLDYYTRKKDYDELEVVSPKTDGKWEKIEVAYNLKNHTLDIGGIKSVILSKSQRSAFRIDSTHLTVERNRNMKFSGRFQAGLVQFINGEYRFNYDDFTVTVDSAEQMMYSELRADENNSLYALPVTSAIYDVSGVVHIDSSANKSGRFLNTGKEFPRFTTKENSFVYYNEEGLANFDPNEFYFKIYPYTKRNLNYVTANNLFLSGEMHTGNMLPVFRDTLNLMYDEYTVEDKLTKEPYQMTLASLGFIHELKTDSVPLFEKGTFNKNEKGKSVIVLSRAGFKGQGKIDWITSEIQADEFNFFSDNIAARAANFTVSESRDDERYPVLSAADVTVQWDAEAEKVTCSTDEGKKMDIFDGKVKMEGTTVYTPEYLMGKGLAEYEDTELESDSIIFRENSFHASKGNYRVYDPESEDKKLLFETKNMKSYTDMQAGKTAFEQVDSTSYANIQSNQYNSYPNYMLWDHETQQAEINQSLGKYANTNSTSGEAALDSTYMVDVANFSPGTFYGGVDSLKLEYKKDGLIFYGTNADYDGDKKRLTVQEVKRIMVADISVIPASEIKIEADGRFGELKKTRVEVLNDSNYVVHEITDVDILITGKNSYTAQSGTYKYRDVTGTDQNVFFSKITYDETKNASVASGSVQEDREFMLSPYFYFKGYIEFNARRDFLTFNGYAKMKEFCNYQGDWFFFKNEINPRDVVIKLDKDLMADSSGLQANIYADIRYLQDSTALTPAFLRTAPGTRTNSIFSARKDGYVVTYQPSENRYIAAPEECITDTMPLANYIAYETDNCLIKTYGELHYANIPHTQFQAAGSSNYDIRSHRYRMNTFTILDFWFNNDATQIMTEKLKMQFPSKPVEINDEFKKSLALTVGKETTQQYYDNQLTDKTLPPPLNSRLVFSGLNFYWNNAEGAFMSTGEASLMAMNGTQINQKISAKIKITSGFKNDEIRLYLYTNNDWFYFRFFDTNLYAYSSVPEFNKAIEDSKLSQRKDPNSRLRYILADKNEAEIFADNF